MHIPQVLLNILPRNTPLMINEVTHIQQLIFFSLILLVRLDDGAWDDAYATLFG